MRTSFARGALRAGDTRGSAIEISANSSARCALRHGLSPSRSRPRPTCDWLGRGADAHTAAERLSTPRRAVELLAATSGCCRMCLIAREIWVRRGKVHGPLAAAPEYCLKYQYAAQDHARRPRRPGQGPRRALEPRGPLRVVESRGSGRRLEGERTRRCRRSGPRSPGDGEVDHRAQRLARHPVRAVDQPLPRLRAWVRLLLRPPDPRLPRPVARASTSRRASSRSPTRRSCCARSSPRRATAVDRDRARRQHRSLSARRARALRITRSILELLAECDHPFTIVTKNALVERDIDLVAPMAAATHGACVHLGDEPRRGSGPQARTARLGAVSAGWRRSAGSRRPASRSACWSRR